MGLGCILKSRSTHRDDMRMRENIGESRTARRKAWHLSRRGEEDRERWRARACEWDKGRNCWVRLRGALVGGEGSCPGRGK